MMYMSNPWVLFYMHKLFHMTLNCKKKIRNQITHLTSNILLLQDIITSKDMENLGLERQLLLWGPTTILKICDTNMQKHLYKIIRFFNSRYFKVVWLNLKDCLFLECHLKINNWMFFPYPQAGVGPH